MSLLGKLMHEEANAIAEKDRGRAARPITVDERREVMDAYGGIPDPSRVRIVLGPGLSYVALAAFLKGNPAITIGNTIYLKWGSKRFDYHDLARSEAGIGLLIHEWSHVVQYHRLGFAVFGARYVRELAIAGGDPDRLY